MVCGFPYGCGDGGTICGSVAGATMVLGAVFGRTEPHDQRQAICAELVRDFNELYKQNYSTVLCPELISDFEFSSPERKFFCTSLLHNCILSFALIMEREKGIKINQLM